MLSKPVGQRSLLPFQLITLPFITILCDVFKSKEYNSWKTADGAPENLLHRRLHTVISWMGSFETDSSCTHNWVRAARPQTARPCRYETAMIQTIVRRFSEFYRGRTPTRTPGGSLARVVEGDSTLSTSVNSDTPASTRETSGASSNFDDERLRGAYGMAQDKQDEQDKEPQSRGAQGGGCLGRQRW